MLSAELSARHTRGSWGGGEEGRGPTLWLVPPRPAASGCLPAAPAGDTSGLLSSVPVCVCVCVLLSPRAL